jgi:hypothetical protein
MQPALEDPMCILASITASATAFPEIGASGAGVMKAARIASSRLLAGMCKWTLGPVMASAAHAAPHLELEHAELVAPIHVHCRPSFLVLVVGGEKLVETVERVWESG